VIRIENAALAVDVVPAMGGKLLHLVDKAADRGVLWRNPRVRLRPGPLHADVDDYFAGGWDDAFPTGDACLNEHGERLPYMGELWNLALDAHVERPGPDEAVLVLDGRTPITPARWTRTLTVRAGEPLLHLRTRIENVGHRPFAFSWGSHPALAVHAGMRLDVPAAAGEVTDAGGGPLGRLGERYAYPTLRAGTGAALDVREVPAPTLADHALHALTGLDAGWIAATDPARRRGFGVAFDVRLHRCVWQWMAYGGFRGWYHAIVEPWTAPQPALDDALAAGRALHLAPGETLESAMTGVLYGGVERVRSLAADGAVT
jgi:galactose mutarotase-like enzyme